MWSRLPPIRRLCPPLPLRNKAGRKIKRESRPDSGRLFVCCYGLCRRRNCTDAGPDYAGRLLGDFPGVAEGIDFPAAAVPAMRVDFTGRFSGCFTGWPCGAAPSGPYPELDMPHVRVLSSGVGRLSGALLPGRACRPFRAPIGTFGVEKTRRLSYAGFGVASPLSRRCVRRAGRRPRTRGSMRRTALPRWGASRPSARPQLPTVWAGAAMHARRCTSVRCIRATQC